MRDMIDLCKAHPKQWRFDLLEPTIPGVDGSRRYFFIIFELNVKEIEKLAMSGSEIPGKHHILDLVMIQEDKDNLSRIFTHSKARIPAKPRTPQKQPTGFHKSIQLYKYQLDCVSWMKSIEDDVAVGFLYTDVVPWYASRSFLMFDTKNREIVLPKSLPKYTTKVFPKGGVLADEVGLGKTIELIALILANPGDLAKLELEANAKNNVAEANTETEEGNKEKEEKGKREGTELSLSESHLRLEEVKKEQTRRSARGKKTSEEATEVVVENWPDVKADRFYTAATLVVCPPHLVKQWHEEIEKCTRPVLNVVVLQNIKDVRSTTYADIISADVVLVTFQLLKNPNYFRIGSSVISTAPRFGEELLRPEWIEPLLKRIRGDSTVNSTSQQSPVMDHFHWHRVVVDEAHEIMGDPFYPNTFSLFEYDHCWFTSGTPFPNLDTSNGLVDFLKFPTPHHHKTSVCGDIIMNNLFWRNTKETIKGEYQIPPFVEDLVLLDLTDIEKAMHSNAGEKDGRKRAACCHPSVEGKYNTLVHGYVSLASIRKAMLKHKEARVTTLKQKKQSLQTEIKDNKKNLSNPYYQEHAQVAERSSEKQYPIEVRPIILVAKEVKEPEPAKGKKAGNSAKGKGKRALDESEAEESASKKLKTDPTLEKKSAADKIKEQNVLKYLIEEHGTKTAHALVYLQKLWTDNPSAKVLLFSQFNSYLDRISALLSNYGVENAFVEGSSVQRTKAIKAFKSSTEDVRAMLLSFTNAASGTNLIEASHIVFLEPPPGSKEEAMAIETQAIGRAYRQGQTSVVTVVRFVSRDSIEYHSYMTNNAQDQIPQIEEEEAVRTIDRGASFSGRPSLQRSSSITSSSPLTASEVLATIGNE